MGSVGPLGPDCARDHSQVPKCEGRGAPCYPALAPVTRRTNGARISRVGLRRTTADPSAALGMTNRKQWRDTLQDFTRSLRLGKPRGDREWFHASEGRFPEEGAPNSDPCCLRKPP